MSPTLLAITIAATAWAQDGSAEASEDGFDAHDFYLAPQDGNPRDPVRVFRPGRFMAGDAYGIAAVEYADESLRQVRELEAESLTYVENRGLITNLLTTNLGAGVAVHDNVRLDAAAPIYMYTRGSDGQTDQAAIGDVRLSSQLAVIRPGIDDEGLGFGVVPWMTLPTGDETTYRGKESVSGGVLGNASVGIDRITISGQAGVGFNPDIQARNVRGRDEIRAGAAVSTLLTDQVGLNVETRIESPLNPGLITESRTPIEGLMSLRGTTKSGAHWLAGASAGFTRAVGAPQWRAFIGGGFGRAQDPDPDLDGILGSADMCPEQPEPVNGYQDEDGCPDDLASLTVRAFYEGEPQPAATLAIAGPDGEEREDKGTVAVYEQIPETTWSAAGLQACLQGAGEITLEEGDNAYDIDLEPVWDSEILFVVSDGADNPIEARLTWLGTDPAPCGPERPITTPDGRAAVPVGAGKHQVLVSAPERETKLVVVDMPPRTEETVKIDLGAARVHVTDDQITLDEKIHFEFDRAVIRPVSFSLLDEVAATMLNNPDIETVEIEGHADERGTRSYNRDLSGRRAESVRDYLVSAGVDADRLETKAYGESDPVVDASNPTAWRANRRVQFTILASTETR